MSVFAGQPPHSGASDVPMVSAADFIELFELDSPTDADLARIETAIEIASGIVRNGRRIFTPVNGAQVVVDAKGGRLLMLPKEILPLRGVSSVVEDGTILNTTDFAWSENGYLERQAGRWPVGLRSVVVTCDHGYDPLPPVIAGICLGIAKRIFDNPDGSAGGIQSETIGSYSVAYATAGAAAGMTEFERQVLDRYGAGR